ncbi:MAG TPA: Hsp70 family protein, partial [Pseudonocardiaceae bacterium]
DRRLVDHLADEFQKENGIDLRADPQALQRLFEAGEKAKVELSSVTQTQVSLPFITADASGPKHLQATITRSTFEQVTADLVERTLDPVKQAMSDGKVSADDIDEVILVGGSTRIPTVQNLVRRLTGGKDPNMTVNPDEVVAVGAAIQAGVLKGEVSDVLLLDVTPLSLGVETRGGVMTRIIDRNTTIPARRSEVFSTAEDNQSAVDVVVLQGERESAADNRVLGRFRLENIRPAPRGEPQVEVTYDIDANGILNVTARDRDTGAEQRITISESSNLDIGEVERMVADADRNRAEDQRLREGVDARNELDTAAADTTSILRGLRERLEIFHGVRIQDAALVAAATLSQRYLTDRFLPDKAIDLVDEACARLRTEIDSMPAELDEITRRVMRLGIEDAALAQETDAASQTRLDQLRKELADLRAQADAMRARWEAERQAIRRVQELRSELEQVRRDVEEAERNYDLNRAAELRYGRLTELERRLTAEEEKLIVKQGEHRLLREAVTEDEIAEIVSAWTGIPITRLKEGERDKLLRLDEVLHERVIGQDEAVSAVTDAIIRARSGIKDPSRPIGSFLEKAHTDVFNTLLQVLDDGRLTDAQGRTVDFRNTVLIMTSNIGSHYLLDAITPEGEIPGEARELVLAELRSHFRPEFLNRIDDIVLFTPLTLEQIESIVELMLGELRERLEDRRITLEVSEEARRHIAVHGYDPVYGARPLRRFIAREVETRIARALLTDDIANGATIRIDLKGDELVIATEQPAPTSQVT